MSAEPVRPPRVVACPSCGAPVAYSPASPWRPFCSERCRRLDLGAWASEAYRIPLREADSGEPGDSGAPDPGEPGK